jgi:Spy/CpxP family protein refolding chaperone
MNTKMRITAMMFLLILGGTGITKAQYGRFAQGNRPNAPLGYCMDIPDLTDEQKVKITALNEEHRATMDQLRTDKYNAPDLYARNEADMKMLAEMNSHMLKLEALMTDTQKEYFRTNYTNGRAGVRAYGEAGFRGRGAGMRAAGRGCGRGFNARPAGRGYGRGGYGPGYR